MNEIWKNLRLSNSLYTYRISNSGKVIYERILTGHSNRRGAIKSCAKKPSLSKSGYYYITISVGDRAKKMLLHRLIAEAFIPNPQNKPDINHINGIKTDNRIDNLEWCTHQENMQHAHDIGLNKGSGKKVICINSGKIYDSLIQAANDLALKHTSVCQVVKGQRNSVYGFKFQYA